MSLSNWGNWQMSTRGLETVLIGNIADSECLTSLLVRPAVATVNNNGLVISADVLQLTILLPIDAIACLQTVRQKCG